MSPAYTSADFRDWCEGVVTCVPMAKYPVMFGAVYAWGVKLWPCVEGESCKVYVRFEDIHDWRITSRGYDDDG